MVESLKELNEICQKPRYKEVGNWMVRTFLRDAALPITWMLLHTKVTANQVTLIAILVGLLGNLMFLFSPAVYFLVGSLLLQLWYLLDHVDGQIARYRQSASLSGRYFDFIMHHLIHGTVMMGLSFYAFFVTSQISLLLGGMIAVVSMFIFNLSYDAQSKAYVEKMSQANEIHALKQKEAGRDHQPVKRSKARSLFSFMHKSCEMHVMMNVLTGMALIQICFTPSIDYRMIAFYFYLVSMPLICIIKISYVIFTNKVDTDFSSNFRVS